MWLIWESLISPGFWSIIPFPQGLSLNIQQTFIRHQTPSLTMNTTLLLVTRYHLTTTPFHSTPMGTISPKRWQTWWWVDPGVMCLARTASRSHHDHHHHITSPSPRNGILTANAYIVGCPDDDDDDVLTMCMCTFLIFLFLWFSVHPSGDPQTLMPQDKWPWGFEWIRFSVWHSSTFCCLYVVFFLFVLFSV